LAQDVLELSYEAWLIGRSKDALGKFVAAVLLVFDFDLFIGVKLVP
jgi:hypothetical protein